MNYEGTPRSKQELLDEEARLIDALRIKAEQTSANVAAGIIAEDAPDEDKDALEAELAEIQAALSIVRASEAEARIDDARQAPLEGM